MYLSFYKLSRKPFNVSADPRFIWLGEKHQEALANLEYGLLESNGYVVLTGGVGTGKTTVVQALLESLGENVLVATVNHPTLNPIEFFNLIAQVLGMSGKFPGKTEFLLSLKYFLQTSHASGKRVLLVIDEAHRLSNELLEEIHLLSNIEKRGKKLINIFLIGQTELKEKLLSRSCRALRKRITLTYNIDPLSEEETRGYIIHRLNVAGTDRNLFTRAAIRRIHNFSRGYPLLINTICDRALLTGFLKDLQEIDGTVVAECVRELDFISPRKRKVAIIPFGKFLGWGRSWAGRLRMRTAALMNPRGRKEKTPGYKHLRTIILKGGLKKITRIPWVYTPGKLIPIGLSALIALVFTTISFGLHRELPVQQEASTHADRAGRSQKNNLPVGQATPGDPQGLENDPDPLIRNKAAKVQKEAQPVAHARPDEARQARISKESAEPIAVRAQVNTKFPPSEPEQFPKDQPTIPEDNTPQIPAATEEPLQVAEPPEADNPPEAPSIENRYYAHEIKWPGERLILLARWYTGKGANWPRLHAANPSIDPKRIKIGDSILIPENLLTTRNPMPKSFLLPKADKTKHPLTPSAQSPANTTEIDLFGPIDSET